MAKFSFTDKARPSESSFPWVQTFLVALLSRWLLEPRERTVVLLEREILIGDHNAPAPGP